MPYGGGNTPYMFDYTETPSGVWLISNDADVRIGLYGGDVAADWISWERCTDPFNGFNASVPNFNITYSALARYLGHPMVLIVNTAGVKTPGQTNIAWIESNNADPALDAVYRCPSDNVENRIFSGEDNSHSKYRYSYTMNICWSMPIHTFAGFSVGQRSDCVFNGKITSIKTPAEKVLYVCEDEQTLENGTYSPSPAAFLAGTYTDQVSSRHTLHQIHASGTNTGYTTGGNSDSYGNVSFCDGHAEYFDRKDAMRQKYTGNPNPDPAGF
jgi:prepilin-type processing-associated H-X9-DG protein